MKSYKSNGQPMKDEVNKIPIRVTIFSGCSSIILGVLYGSVARMETLSATDRGSAMIILNWSVMAIRCPLAAILTFATNKTTNKLVVDNNMELQTYVVEPRKLLPRNAIV